MFPLGFFSLRLIPLRPGPKYHNLIIALCTRPRAVLSGQPSISADFDEFHVAVVPKIRRFAVALGGHPMVRELHRLHRLPAWRRRVFPIGPDEANAFLGRLLPAARTQSSLALLVALERAALEHRLPLADQTCPCGRERQPSLLKQFLAISSPASPARVAEQRAEDRAAPSVRPRPILPDCSRDSDASSVQIRRG